MTDAINCRQHHYKTVKKKIANIPRNGLDGPTIGFAHSHCHVASKGPSNVVSPFLLGWAEREKLTGLQKWADRKETEENLGT